MQREVLSNGGVGYVAGKGRAAIWLPARGLVIVRLGGHGDADLALPIIEAIDESLRRARRVRVFFEAEKLSTYDSALRTRLTQRLRRDRDRFESIHVLVASKLVAMGVSVASLALDGKVTSHSERNGFLAELKSELARGGLAAFPLQALTAA
jgi:hypothetical protein